MLVSFIPILVVETKLDHHLKTKILGNSNRTLHLKSCNGALRVNVTCERLRTDR